MKIRKIYAIAVAIVMLFSIAAFSACANNEPQTLSEKKQSFLQGIWQSIDNFEFNEKYEYYKELYKAQVADDISKASSETDLYKIKNDARETMSKVMYYQYIAGPVRDWSVILINGKTEDGDYTITLHPSYTYPNRYRLKADYTAKDSGISIKAIMFEKTAGNETFTAKGEFVEDITRPDIIWDDSFGHEKYALCFVATKAGANIGCSVIVRSSRSARPCLSHAARPLYSRPHCLSRGDRRR